MSDTNVTVIGNVASDVQSKPTPTGVVTSFRLASQRRYYNRRAGRWVDDDPAFYRVVCWRSLAENVRDCVRKGEPVVVQGRLKLTDWTDEKGHTRTDAEVDARSIGYDLMRGTAVFTRSRRQVVVADDGEDPLDHIRSEQRANAAHDVIVDPSTGEVFTVSQLRGAEDRPGAEARPGNGERTGESGGTGAGVGGEAGGPESAGGTLGMSTDGAHSGAVGAMPPGEPAGMGEPAGSGESVGPIRSAGAAGRAASGGPAFGAPASPDGAPDAEPAARRPRTARASARAKEPTGVAG